MTEYTIEPGATKAFWWVRVGKEHHAAIVANLLELPEVRTAHAYKTYNPGVFVELRYDLPKTAAVLDAIHSAVRAAVQAVPDSEIPFATFSEEER